MEKLFARRTRCEQEFADGLAPVGEGQDERVGGWFLARGRDDLEVVAVPRERDGGVGQLERLPDGLRRSWATRSRGRALLRVASPGARSTRVGLISLAVHQAVDAALQPLSQRLEEDGHESGGQQRDGADCPATGRGRPRLPTTST